jgi:hypothetical protein
LKESMQNQSIFRIAGKGGALCTIRAQTGDNAKTLRPLAQLVEHVEQARKNAGFSSASKESYIDASLSIEFPSGNIVQKTFRQVLIDLSSGREPHLVFIGTPDGHESVSVTFTSEVASEWSTPRVNAGCLWCGGSYQCQPCKTAKATPATAPA